MNKIQKTFKYATALTTVLMTSPLSALAQERIELDLPERSDFRSVTDITPTGVVQFVISGILILAALVAFIYLLFGGAQWVLAGGDKEGTEKARKRITNALIGLAITFSAYAIAFLVREVFNVNILSFDIPSIVQP